MKICLLSYRGNPYCGGQGVYLFHLAMSLVNLGHEVHVVTGPPWPDKMTGVTLHKLDCPQLYGKDVRDIAQNSGLRQLFSPVFILEYIHSLLGSFSEIESFGYRAFQYVRSLHREIGFDIIHDNQSLAPGILLLKSLGIPVCATIHHPLYIDRVVGFERLRGLKKKLKTCMFYPLLMQKLIARNLDHIITVSNSARDENTRHFGISASMQTVIHNGVDLKRFTPGVRGDLPWDSLIFVGNVEDQKKGFVYLLRAVALMKRKISLLVVDGGAPHRRGTKVLIEKLGIKSKVKFKGALSTPEMVQLYRKVSIAVVPSVYEGFGFPAVEAMACGVPVIASTGGALPEIIGNAGVLVPERDSEKLAEAIEKLLDDQEMQFRLSREGRERVKNHFTWYKAGKELEKCYNRIIALKYS